ERCRAMAEVGRSDTGGASPAASRARVARLQEPATGLGTACAGVEADRLAVRARLSRLRTIAAGGPEAWVHEPIESEALEALRHAVVDCEKIGRASCRELEQGAEDEDALESREPHTSSTVRARAQRGQS